MSDPVECDKCGTIGRRKRGAIAPVGWYYVTLQCHGESVYVYACTTKCTQLAWQSGPGSLADVVLHPAGRCTCAQEGTCEWCTTHCVECGSTTCSPEICNA